VTREQLRGMVCWKPGAVHETILTEADAPPDAVFLATHVETPIFRRQVGTTAQGVEVTEAQVLHDLEHLPADMPILPILGESGTGKSHLVRWLRLQLRETAARRVVWIPKYRTNLRGVLETILEQPGSAELDEVRREIIHASDQYTEVEARLRLLTTLANRIELHGAGPEDEMDREPREYVAASLPALLLDPVFKEQLLTDGATIGRIVHEKLVGREFEDKEEPFAFRLEDLPLRPSDASRAGATARELMSYLVADRELQQVTVTMMNEQRDAAIAEIFGVGRGQLREVMLKLRRLLHQQGIELILLIEDFTILQGLQGELLDAIIEAPLRDGRQELCTIRVAMAVTEGYFRDHVLATVRTRTLHEYVLDMRLSDIDQDKRHSFVTAYLNATRVGRESLEQAYDLGGGDWIPNACETCPVQEPCHEGFGAVDGRGLYPFNHAALERAIKSKSNIDLQFVPRTVLTRVLRPVLADHADAIREGEFPSKEFANDFRDDLAESLSIRVRRELEQRSRNAARHEVLLTFWADAPEQVVNLPRPVHDAFDIPQLDGANVAVELDGYREQIVRESPPEQQGPPPLVAAVQQWHKTGDLRRAPYNELRKLAHRAVFDQLDLENGFWRSKEWEDRGGFRQQRVFLRGESPSVEEVSLWLRHTDLDDVEALVGLSWFADRGHWRFPGGARLQRLVKSQIDRWTTEVREQLLPEGFGGRAPNQIEALVRTLVVEGRILGLPGGDDDTDLLALAFDPGPTLDGMPSAGIPLWDRLRAHVVTGSVKDADSRRQLRERLLRLVAFSQDGAPKAVDVNRLAKALARVGRDWQLPASTETLPAGVRLHIDRTAKVLPDAVETRLTELREWVDCVTPLLPQRTSLSDVVAEIDRAIDHARQLGLLSTGASPESMAREGQRVAAEPGVDLLKTTARELRKWDTLSYGKQLLVLAEDREPDASQLRLYLVEAAKVLQLIDQAAAAYGRGADSEDTTAQARIEADLGKLQSDLSFLAGIDEEVQA